MKEHDYINYPELTNAEIEEFGLLSPHIQFTEDFDAVCVKVHDGDTITLKHELRDFNFPLRFLSIDSPEMNEGGEAARDWLKSQIEGERVQIIINKKNRVDKYGRLLGDVISNGINMGEAEERMGYAVPFGKKKEGEVPKAEKIFSLKQWF